jgi:hypothetical protein
MRTIMMMMVMMIMMAMMMEIVMIMMMATMMRLVTTILSITVRIMHGKITSAQSSGFHNVNKNIAAEYHHETPLIRKSLFLCIWECPCLLEEARKLTPS